MSLVGILGLGGTGIPYFPLTRSRGHAMEAQWFYTQLPTVEKGRVRMERINIERMYDEIVRCIKERDDIVFAIGEDGIFISTKLSWFGRTKLGLKSIYVFKNYIHYNPIKTSKFKCGRRDCDIHSIRLQVKTDRVEIVINNSNNKIVWYK